MKKPLLIGILALFILISVSSAMGTTNLNTGLVSYWTFDDEYVSGATIIDSLSLYNGTNDGTINQSGFIGESRYFDGTNDVITIGTNLPAFELTNFTIAFWFKPLELNVDRHMFTNADLDNVASDPRTGYCTGIKKANDGTNPNKQFFNTVNASTSTSQIYGSTTTGIWQFYTATFQGTNGSIYLNGTMISSSNSMQVPTYADNNRVLIGALYDSHIGNGYWYQGNIDEVMFYNYAMNETQVSELFTVSNSGQQYPFTTPSPTSLTINWTAPDNATSYNTATVNFTFSFNSTNNTLPANCSLYQDSILNYTWTNVYNGTTHNTTLTYSAGTEDDFDYYIFCNNGVANSTTATRTIYVDYIDPFIYTDFINNSLWYNTNMTGQFNFTDGLMLHSLNVTIDGSEIFSNSSIGSATYQYNLSYNVSSLSIGKHILGVKIADGHTAARLKDDYSWSNGLFDNYLRYDIYDKISITTSNKKSSLMDKWETFESFDRWNQVYYPANPSETITLIEESTEKIHIVGVPGHYNDYWIITGNHWKDYVVKDEPGARVSINRINDYKVEVTISGIRNNPGRIEFQSIGDLNIVERNYTFYAINMTETYGSTIYSGVQATYNLNVSFGELEPVIFASYTPSVKLVWNGTQYSSTRLVYNNQTATFRQYVTPPGINISNTQTIPHYWNFTMQNITLDSGLQTDNQTQTLYNVSVGLCTSPHNFTIINFTYFDEKTRSAINLTNDYDLTFSADFDYEMLGSFAESAAVSNRICTNVDPSDATYNFNMYGSMTLSKDDYVTRIFPISSAAPVSTSNNPHTTYPLYLIKTNESTTVKFNWLSTDYQRIDGYMKIYACDANNTRTLVEIAPIMGGVAYANIVIITQPYAYEVLIGDTVYSDLSAWGACHMEFASEATYYVDLAVTDVSGIIGLAGVKCYMTAVGRDVTMTWGTNTQDSSAITGCIIPRMRTIAGWIELNESCESTLFTNTYSVPNDGNEYVIIGTLTQSGIQRYCGDDYTLSTRDSTGGTWGMAGLFAAFLLVASIVLFFAGNGELAVAAAGIGFMIAWIVGLLNFSWLVVSAVVALCIIVGLIGRYARRPSL